MKKNFKYQEVPANATAARLKRYAKIRDFFGKKINTGFDYNYVINLCVEEFGYAHATIEKIVNNYGYYKDK